ncbi:MAG: NAD(P)H-dependent oxidoreductase subunit E [Nitrososphaerales archaeon]
MAEASQILASDETIKVMEILKRYSSDKDNLIPILQEIQKNVGYLSPDFVRLVSKHLKISASSIYGVATFYTMFKFAKPAKHNIKVCLGTSCHVKGGDRILETFERLLEVRCGESSRDLMFSLERVACLGSCALAPVVVIDDTIYGNMHVDRIKPILSKIRG